MRKPSKDPCTSLKRSTSDMTKIIFFLLLALGFIALLFTVQVTGEESVYTIGAYEMWYHEQWLSPTLYGDAYRRPPLINWLIIAISYVVGWEYSIAAVRLVSAISTIASAWLIYWFLKRVSKDAELAWLGAIIYLTTWQVIGGYGWKGYSDALFGMCCLAGMLYGILSVREKDARWMLLACFFAFLGFLTKAITAFVFLGAAISVALWITRDWRFLLRPMIVGIGILTLTSVLAWYQISPTGNSMASGMVADVFGRYLQFDLKNLLIHIFQYPFDTALNLLPYSVLIPLYLYRNRSVPKTPDIYQIIGITALINFIPYWITPTGHSRYLMPLYGLVAIYLASMAYQSAVLTKQIHRLAFFVVVFKLAFAVFLFPLYTSLARPNIKSIATDIVKIADKFDVYSIDETWIGIGVSDQINKMRYPRKPITNNYESAPSGFLLSAVKKSGLGNLVKDYNQRLFLYCFGDACQK